MSKSWANIGMLNSRVAVYLSGVVREGAVVRGSGTYDMDRAAGGATQVKRGRGRGKRRGGATRQEEKGSDVEGGEREGRCGKRSGATRLGGSKQNVAELSLYENTSCRP